MKHALVCGAGGFIGFHLVNRLKEEGFWVLGVDLKHPEFGASRADEFIIGDLRDPVLCHNLLNRPFDEVYQLAADMGGAGYLFTGDQDADVMHNSAMINLNMVEACHQGSVDRIFYSSSACVYPLYNQKDPQNPLCTEESVYPAEPDSEYGWEKLFSERLYAAYARNYGLKVRVARYHNVYGPEGTWQGGREKVPAAMCRKVVQAPLDGSIEIWGDGEQTRSFLYITDCIEATTRLMRSDFAGPVNIGSEEMVTINHLADLVMSISSKKLDKRHIPGPEGVRGRCSDNQMIGAKIGWQPEVELKKGIAITYKWIAEQIKSGGLV
jgi:GDP-D-mannose 3',5'-epimerase